MMKSEARRDWLEAGRFGRHDSRILSNVPGVWPRVARGKGGKKAKLAYLKFLQQGKDPNQRQKWATFLEPSKLSTLFGLGERLIFWTTEKGEEVKCTI